MNEEKLDQILEAIADRLLATEAFVLEQMPTLLQQILIRDSVFSILSILIALIVVFIFWKTFSQWSRQEEDGTGAGYWSDSKFLSFIGFGASIIWAGTIIYIKVRTLLSIYVAPDLYLLEYIRDFI